MSGPFTRPMGERTLRDRLLGDLDYAAHLLADIDAADRDGDPVHAVIARGQLGITLDWMRDRLRHAAGTACFFGPHKEYCPLEWDRGARAVRDPDDEDGGEVPSAFWAGDEAWEAQI